MIYVFTCSDLKRARVVTTESEAIELLKEASLSYCWLEVYDSYPDTGEEFTALQKSLENLDNVASLYRAKYPERIDDVYQKFTNTISAILHLEIVDGPYEGMGALGIADLLCIFKGPGVVLAEDVADLSEE